MAAKVTNYVVVAVDSNGNTIAIKTSTALPSTLLTMKRNDSSTTNTTSYPHGVSSYPNTVTFPSVQATAIKAAIGDVDATSNGAPALIPTEEATSSKNTPASAPEAIPEPEAAPAPEATPEATPEPAPASDYSSGSSSGSSSDNNFALDMLKSHNSKRAEHGATPLSWSYDLEGFAQGCANKYRCGSELDHSNGPYGENLALGADSAEDAVNKWNKEATQYDHSSYSKLDHFTQVIWKSTTELGCAFKVCPNGKYIICSYYPPGNIIGQGRKNLSLK
ncbi:PR-1-like protein [Metschnikowia bicuspidata]|uniref:PR-1-like protein n=1 Tax=Metschnikowia bicuspidata TaxID=27322 RepID=A0A4P9Z920_9ASCO|nr:PR-1-like protein [Metschnikowia bicuspidata]